MKKIFLLMGVSFFGSSFLFSQKKVEVPKFSSHAEKVAWIAAHPVDYQQMSEESLPVSNQIPEFSTQEEKNAWQQANSQSTGGAVTSTGQSVKEVIMNPADPTFPKMILTGNPDADATNYSAAKDAWYASNHSNYHTIGRTSVDAIESVIYMSQEEFKALPSEKQASVLSDPIFIIIN